MKKLLSFYFLFILCSSIYSKEQVKIIYSNFRADSITLKPPFNQHLTQEMLNGLDSICSKPDGIFSILIDKDQIIANRNGFLNVYKWENEKWVDLYKGIYGGHNFGSFCFIYNDELYAYGGYGYWQFNSNLIKFNKVAGGWDLVQSIDSFQGVIQPFVRLVEDELQIVGSNTYDHEKTIPDKNKAEINLTDNRIKIKQTTFKIDTSLSYKLTNGLKVFNIKKYGIKRIENFNQVHLLIHDFETGQYYLQDELIPLLEFIPLSYSDGQELYFLDPQNELIKITEDILMKGAKPVGVPRPTKLTNGETLLSAGATLSILLLLSGYLFYKKRRKQPLISTPASATAGITYESEDEQIIKMMGNLSVVENTVITPNRLDNILQIDDLDLDSKRARRSQLIKTINAFTQEKIGFEYINRVRDDKDKRYVNYKIGKPDKPTNIEK